MTFNYRIREISSLSRKKNAKTADFAEILGRLRKGRGLSQAQLGALIKESADTIGRWERRASAHLTPDQLKNLAGVLDVSVDELVGYRPLGAQARLLLELELPILRDVIRTTSEANDLASAEMQKALARLDKLGPRKKNKRAPTRSGARTSQGKKRKTPKG